MAAPASKLPSIMLNQCMLRVKDPVKSLAFYKDAFGMSLICTKHFDKWKFSLYFLATLPEGIAAPADPTSEEADTFLGKGEYKCCLELTHNHGTESDEAFSYHNGNVAPVGFSHVGFSVKDVAKAVEELGDVKVLAAPGKGPSGGALVQDPDGYHVSIVPSSHAKAFSRIAFRVKDPEKSVAFYEKHFGFTFLDKVEDGESKETSYILSTMNEGVEAPAASSDAAKKFVTDSMDTFLELRHIPGLDVEKFNNGNVEPDRGFGHIAVHVDDVYKTSEELEKDGVAFKKRPDEGNMKGLAFALDPDGYWIEIIRRRAPVPS